MSHLLNFSLILAFTICTLLKYGFDKMFYSGLAVLILIILNCLICLWQWSLNNLFKYEWIEYEAGNIGTNVKTEENSENNVNDIVHNNVCSNICVDNNAEND